MQWILPGVLALEAHEIVVACSPSCIDDPGVIAAILRTNSHVLGLDQVSLEEHHINFVFVPGGDVLVREGVEHGLDQLLIIDHFALRDCLSWAMR